MYFGLIKKRYGGRKNSEEILNWISSVINNLPSKISKWKDIDSSDSHHFVYVKKQYYDNNTD